MNLTPYDPAEISTPAALRSLRSEVCPACTGQKRSGHTLCGGCYHRLPPDAKNHLYLQMGRGYEQAVHAAFQHLGRTTFNVPVERARRRR